MSWFACLFISLFFYDLKFGSLVLNRLTFCLLIHYRHIVFPNQSHVHKASTNSGNQQPIGQLNTRKTQVGGSRLYDSLVFQKYVNFMIFRWNKARKDISVEVCMHIIICLIQVIGVGRGWICYERLKLIAVNTLDIQPHLNNHILRKWCSTPKVSVKTCKWRSQFLLVLVLRDSLRTLQSVRCSGQSTKGVRDLVFSDA